MLGLKIPYFTPGSGRKSVDKSASASVCRPALEAIGEDSGDVIGVCSQDFNGLFRNVDGTSTGMVLELRLSDLLPAEVLDLDLTCLEHHNISIPLDPMAELLIKAETELSFAGTSFTSETSASTKRKTMKFRKRKRTPPSEDEVGEAQVSDKDDTADADYAEKKRRNVRRRKSTRKAAGRVEDVALRSNAITVEQSRDTG